MMKRTTATSEDEYRLFFEDNPQPMWVFDQGTLKVLLVNEAAVRHYGYSRAEWFKMNILELEMLENVDKVKSAERQRIEGLRRPERRQHRVKSGRLIDVEITSRSVTCHDRAATLVWVLDITERLQTEAQLRQSEEKYFKAFRSCPLAIMIITLAEGRCVEANDAFLNMFGYSRRDLEGNRALETDIWAFPQDRETMILELRRSGRIGGFETVFNSKSEGPRRVRLLADRIQLQQRTACVVAITQDVTGSKRPEEQRCQAEKEQALARSAGGTAHDFNNMLGIILGYCDVDESRLSADAARNHIRQIRKAAQRAANLTRQLLGFTRESGVRSSIFNLNTVVEELNQMLHRVLPQNIVLRFQGTDQPGNIKADLSQMEQVLVNLIVNARDAIPTGGEITIQTQNIELDETYARLHPGVAPGSYAVLSINDTGCGMTEDTMKRIFEPFYTSKPVGEGSGLGLSRTCGFIQESGGHIAVSSRLGIGTTFQLYFPRVDDVEQIGHTRYSSTKSGFR